MNMLDAAICERRRSDWPLAVTGWQIIGGGKNVPGYASEKSATLAIRTNPAMYDQSAIILPFEYWDGGLMGPYSELKTRYAILVKEKQNE